MTRDLDGNVPALRRPDFQNRLADSSNEALARIVDAMVYANPERVQRTLNEEAAFHNAVVVLDDNLTTSFTFDPQTIEGRKLIVDMWCRENQP